MATQPDHLLPCIVTHYRIDYEANELLEIVRAETTGYHISDDCLYLHNSCASVSLANLFTPARAGMGWLAQAGAPPVFADGVWGGRNWPKIWVSSESLRQLEEVLACLNSPSPPPASS